MIGTGITARPRDGGGNQAAWVAVALAASLLGGLLPGFMKVLALVPILAAAAGSVAVRTHWVLLPAILFCPFNFESLISRIGIPFVNPFNVAWAAAAGTVALIAWRERRFPLEGTAVDRFLLFNILVTTFTVARASQVIPSSHYGDVVMTYQQWLQWLAFYWIVARLVDGVGPARHVVLAVSGMVAIAAVFGIKDYVSTRAVSGGAIERSQGLFNQANYAASFFAYYMPVVVSVAMVRDRWWMRLGLIIAAGLGGTALVLTFGRGGLMAMAVALVLLAWLKRSTFLLVVIVIAALNLGANPMVRARFSETTSRSGAGSVELDDSSGARLIAWQKAIDLASQRPLTGWGFFTFRHIRHPLDDEAAARFGHGRMDVHNGHLNTLVSGGLLGSLALYAQFGGIAAWCLRLRRDHGHPFVVALATGLAVSVVAIMIVNLFGTRLYDRQMMGFFWIMLGALHGAAKTSVPE